MLIWILFAALTAVAAIAVLVPYSKGRRLSLAGEGADHDVMGGSDAEVYKDQLNEIERDAARGVLSDAEADAARLEISRRLLKANDVLATSPTDHEAVDARPKAIASWQGRLVLIIAFVVVPLASVALYLEYGSPGMSDRPLEARFAEGLETQDLAILVARVESAVEDDPNDIRAWSLLAPIYARQGRFFQARGAYNQLLRLRGEDAQLRTDLGELIVVENEGLVTQEAMANFVTALDLEPTLPKARYYRALGLAQEGQSDEAEAVLLALRNDGDPDSPWMRSVDALLSNLEGAQRLPAPSSQAAGAIAALPQNEQQQAIAGMVESLAARLAEAPEDLAGWSQLVRAYMVLGQEENARRSLLTALDHFASDDPARLRLLTVAQELGLDASR